MMFIPLSLLMRKITTITTVLAISLTILFSGTIAPGLACAQLIQIEGIEGTELFKARAKILFTVLITKQIKNNFSPAKETFALVYKKLPNKVISSIFSFKNSIFIRNCSFLI